MADQLFQRPPRRMRQPSKDRLREQLALAATAIEQKDAEIERLRNNRRRWWWPFKRKAA